MTLQKTLTHAAGAAAAVGALLLSGWAAGSRGPAAQAHPFTLAPIMATRSTGNGRPQRAVATAVAVSRRTSPPSVLVVQSQR